MSFIILFLSEKNKHCFRKEFFLMHLTNKNTCAPTPPMGWNSYDYYDTTVDEAAVKANADYMAST